MTTYTGTLQTLSTAIISTPAQPALDLIHPKPQLSAAEQLAIYQTSYRIRLKQAITTDYPCLAKAMPADDFNQLLDRYISTTPSTSYNLDFYPLNFWSFVRDHHTVACSEIATLEGAIAAAFILPDSTPLNSSELSTLSPDELEHTHFKLRRASRLLQFHYNTEATLQAFRQNIPAPERSLQDHYLLIYRHNNEVQRHPLDAVEYQLLCAIHKGDNFKTAIATVLKNNAALNEEQIASLIARWFPRWINHGYFQSLTFPAH